MAAMLTGSKNRLSGIYVLIFHLPEAVTVTIGRRGNLEFQCGWYGYVGSGKSGVEARVRRHLRTHDRPHWHLDYLMHLGKPTTAIIGHTEESLECPLARHLEALFQVVPRFGSSDCRCSGHLFHSPKQALLETAAVQGMTELGCSPTSTPIHWNWEHTIV
jgi:Uri superfamily endonuclease